MRTEYLKDYNEKENEEINTFLDRLYKGHTNISYPDKNRFHKLNEPVGRAFLMNSIWPQIPLFGSLIIEINPVPEKWFYQFHGMEKKDFERLIDFSKDTGKIQFMINGNPESYAGLDFLSPLFDELHPPISYSIPIASLFEEKDLKQLKYYATEFNNLISLPSQTGMNFVETLKYMAEFSVTHYTLNEMLNENLQYYVFLKGNGYNEIIEYFEKLLILDSKKGVGFLSGIGKLIVEPKLCAFNSDHVFSFEALTKLSYGFDKSDLMNGTNNIHEIGKFLLNKLTFMPESFDACKDVISRYGQEDLYKVSASLHEGVIKSNPDMVCKKNIELSEILDNVWNDAKLEKRIKGVNYGIPISTALIGTLAAGPVGGVEGLLSGLGVNVISEIIGVDQDSIAEKIAKKTVPNQIVNIFDFKKKYHLDKI